MYEILYGWPYTVHQHNWYHWNSFQSTIFTKASQLYQMRFLKNMQCDSTVRAIDSLIEIFSDTTYFPIYINADFDIIKGMWVRTFGMKQEFL